MTSDIYILRSAEGDPNNFAYDISLLGMVGNRTIDSDELGLTSEAGYSLAVYINAVNETSNQLLGSSLQIYFSEEQNGAASMDLFFTESFMILLIMFAVISH